MLFAIIAASQIGVTPPQTIEVAPGEGIAVHAAGRTADPAVVIVPGLVGSAYGYRKLSADLVARRLRVLIVDPLGTGYSHSPDEADYSATAQASRIVTAASLSGVRDAVFLCHALAATICYRAAFAYPGIVTGIVAINGPAVERLATPGLDLALKLKPLIDLFGDEGFVRGKLRNGLIRSSHDAAWVTDSVVAGYTAHYTDGLGAVLKSLRRIADATEPDSLAPALPLVQTPVHLLVGRGAHGESMKAEEIELLRALPHLTIEMVDEAGLYVHEEKPDRVLQAILSMSSTSGADDERRTLSVPAVPPS